MRLARPIRLLLFALVALTPLARADEPVRFRVLALTGTQAPGLPDGVLLRTFTDGDLNHEGQVVFRADLLPNNSASFLATRDGIELLAADGDPAPGLAPGIEYAGEGCFHCAVPPLPGPRIDDAGIVAFSTPLQAPSLPFPVPFSALFLRDAGGVRPILVGEDPAPGDPNFPILFTMGVPVVARSRIAGGNDDIAVTVVLRSPIGNQHDAILAGLPDHPRLVAEVGTPAADHPDGITYGTLLILPPVDDRGGVAFQTSLVDTTHHVRSTALLVEREGQVRFVFETGQQTVGQPAGVLLTSFEEAGRNRRGHLALVGKLEGAGIDFGRNHIVILSDRSGIWETIAQTGDAPRGLPGDRYTDLNGPLLNDRGDLVLSASLNGIAGSSDGEAAILLDTGARSRVIARGGNAAADLPAGIVYEDLAPEALNRRAQVAFRATLSGPSVDTGNARAVFLTGTNGRPRLVLREGDLFEVQPGDLRTIHTIVTLTHGHPRIEPKVLNDRGQLLLRVFFTDQSHALILASVSPGGGSPQTFQRAPDG